MIVFFAFLFDGDVPPPVRLVPKGQNAAGEIGVQFIKPRAECKKEALHMTSKGQL